MTRNKGSQPQGTRLPLPPIVESLFLWGHLQRPVLFFPFREVAGGLCNVSVPLQGRPHLRVSAPFQETFKKPQFPRNSLATTWQYRVYFRSLPWKYDKNKQQLNSISPRLLSLAHIMKKTLITVIDDSPPILEYVDRVLRKHYSVTTFSSVEKALPTIEKADLIISDWQMSGLGGAGLIEHLKQTQMRPLLIITALDIEGPKLQIAKDLAIPILGKPFRPHELLSAVEAILATGP